MATIIHKQFDSIPSFLAGDHTILKEVLHPHKDDVQLPYSIAYAKLNPEEISLPHQLKSSEVYIFLEGEGILVIGNNRIKVKKGELVVVPALENQHLINTTKNELVFLCIVAPAWTEKDEIIF